MKISFSGVTHISFVFDINKKPYHAGQNQNHFAFRYLLCTGTCAVDLYIYADGSNEWRVKNVMLHYHQCKEYLALNACISASKMKLKTDVFLQAYWRQDSSSVWPANTSAAWSDERCRFSQDIIMQQRFQYTQRLILFQTKWPDALPKRIHNALE